MINVRKTHHITSHPTLKESASPPRTKPLVAIAEVDRPVMVVTKVAIRMMAMVRPVEKPGESEVTEETVCFK